MSDSKPATYGSTFARVFGYVWVVLAAAMAANLVADGHDKWAWVGGAALAFLTAVIYATCIRPRILLGPDGVLVRNPLRDAFIPWGAVDDVSAAYAVTIRSGDTTIRSWTPQSSSRDRARSLTKKDRPAGMSVDTADEVRGRTHVDYVAGRIAAMAEEHSGAAAAGGARISWFLPTIIALAGTAAFVVVTVLL